MSPRLGQSLGDASRFYWYHCIRLEAGTTDGDYDLEPLIPRFQIPEDLSGKTVLDVGRASGFFSFLMESRGADVTATDLPSYLDWDFVGAEKTIAQRREIIGAEKEFTTREILGAFDFARESLGSKVRSKLINVYDLSEESMGQTFDLVFCGSLLSHVRDPILALECLRSVTGDRLILSCPVLPKSYREPVMQLIGTADSDRRSWWVPSVSCVEEMLRSANFDSSKCVSRFDLKNLRIDLTVPHAVFHAQGGQK